MSFMCVGFMAPPGIRLHMVRDRENIKVNQVMEAWEPSLALGTDMRVHEDNSCHHVIPV
jgi:hypothetical protein